MTDRAALITDAVRSSPAYLSLCGHQKAADELQALLDHLSAPGGAERKPFRMLVDPEWLIDKILNEPEGEVSAGIYHPEAPAKAAMMAVAEMLSKMDPKQVRREHLDEAAAIIHALLRQSDAPALTYKLGDPVTLRPGYKYGEWVGVPLFVAGMTASLNGEVNVCLSENWPPKHSGDYTDDFRLDDICHRVVAHPAGEG